MVQIYLSKCINYFFVVNKYIYILSTVCGKGQKIYYYYKANKT